MYGAQANAELSGLQPQLQQEATNPQGYGPATVAKMNTAAQQSAGGAIAGAVGQGNLEAARTRNAGAFTPALDNAAQAGGQQLSQAALGVQNKDANLKEQQRQEGLKGMLGLYDTSTAAGLSAGSQSNQALGEANGALGAANGAVNAGTQAANSTNNEWMSPLGMFLH